MEKPLTEAKNYLQEILGVTSANSNWGQPWAAVRQLPFFLQDNYEFYQIELFEEPCLLMLSRTPEGETPAVVRKHWQAVGKHFKGDVIYLVQTITSYNRKRMIEQQVPFLVPGSQLYLPMLGVDLRERFKQGQREDKPKLSAAAQALVIREILLNDCSATPAKVLADCLGYSSMTVSRAIKELEDKELIKAEKVGREKRLHFKMKGRQLWMAALPALQSPVKKRVWAFAHGRDRWIEAADARLAGEAAMVRYTMLAGPDEGILAVNASEWPGLKKLLSIEELEGSIHGSNAYRHDSDVVQVELWAYSPAIFDYIRGSRSEKMVDPLSLWLSFEKVEDERLEMARDSLLNQVWSKLPW